MADSGVPPPPVSPAPPHHHNGTIRTPKSSPPSPHHQNRLGSGPSNTTSPGPSNSSRTRTSSSSSPLRTLSTLGGLVSSGPGPGGPEGSSTRPRGQSLGSALSSRTRTSISRTKQRSSQQEEEEPEALLDLILEVQGQRLNDQRASVSLLPDPGPAGLCGACSPDNYSPDQTTSLTSVPSLDFYYMLIHYQSDRMEDQRCPLPDLEDVGQEDFFSLVQRVQSRRMDEQRASLDMHTAGSAHQNKHHHHHHQ